MAVVDESLVETELETETRTESEAAQRAADDAFQSLMTVLRDMPDGLVVEQCANFERHLMTERLLTVARMSGSTGNVAIDRRRARNTLTNLGSQAGGQQQNSFGRSINRDARRAAAVAANDRLGQQLSDGAIAPESIDVLTKVADESTGEIPVELVDAILNMSPDQAARTVQDRLEADVDPNDVERQYRRQRRARRAYRYESSPGVGRPALSGIALEGPKADIARLWAQISASADAAYQAAGGRTRSAVDHKSLDNRLYDALVAALDGRGENSGFGRPSIVVTVDAEALFGDPGQAVVATQVGSGPIPESLLADYAGSGSIAVLLTHCDGSPLWLGRSRRPASHSQFLALAVRDRGCVLCRAGLDRCQAHHVIPWSSPGRGRTDIDQLALLCQQCHRDLHHRNHTLEFTHSAHSQRLWSTRPATPEETPAPKPRYRQRE